MSAIVIDDSRAMRSIVKRVLTNMGMTDIAEGQDGQDALNRLSQIAVPELAMVDWNMPNMNGLEFVKAVRAKPEYDNMKIVMVTTEVEMDNVVNALNAGANEYVMKPFTEEIMREKLEMLGFARAA